MATATNVTVIPAKPQTANNRSQYKQLRVAAYCRVSTEQEEQQNSYQVQIEYYTDLIHSKKEWTLAGIFADEGISGTQTKKRTEFNRMIRMCKQKKIDLILTKSISRFARNTVDCHLDFDTEVSRLNAFKVSCQSITSQIKTACIRKPFFCLFFLNLCLYPVTSLEYDDDFGFADDLDTFNQFSDQYIVKGI